MHFQKILVTTDFSEDSLRAFEIAAQEAKAEASEIHLLTVLNDWDVPPIFLHDIANPEAIVQYGEQVRKKAEEKLSEYASTYFKGQQIRTQVVSSPEAPADAIVNYAKDEQIDLILISSHGRGAVGQLFLGSVVQRVLRQASCPVLVIPKNL